MGVKKSSASPDRALLSLLLITLQYLEEVMAAPQLADKNVIYDHIDRVKRYARKVPIET